MDVVGLLNVVLFLPQDLSLDRRNARLIAAVL